jgi:uncharacterized protein YndB with AHSA1/START domain
MADFRFTKQYVVYASPETVFEALTDPGIIAAWGGGMSVVGSEPGGHFEWFDGWVKGEITGFENAKELAFTWKPSEWDKRTKASKVVIRFVAHPAGTQLTIEHTDFSNPDVAEKSDDFWVDHILDPINDYFIAQMS